MLGFVPLAQAWLPKSRLVLLEKKNQKLYQVYPERLKPIVFSEKDIALSFHHRQWFNPQAWQKHPASQIYPLQSQEKGVCVFPWKNHILLLFYSSKIDLKKQEALEELLTILEQNHLLSEENNLLKLQLEALFVFHQQALGTFHLPSLVENFMRILTNTFNYGNCALLLYDPERKDLYILSAINYPEEVVKNFRIPLGKGITGFAAEKRVSVIVDDVRKDPRYIQGVPNALSEIAIPLIYQNELLGVLDVESTQLGAFSYRDRMLLEPLSGMMALLIKNSQLFKEREDMLLQTVEALAEAIEAKDPYMRGHITRSAYYGEVLAKKAGLSPQECFYVRLACILHDIGKIGIPEAILQKPGPLTEEERKVMERHVEIGVQILREVDFLKPVVPMVEAHQEKWDGSGYPQGLKGEAIPLGSRIVALVDAYDAMTTHRPYRRALTLEEVIQELENNKGKQFDPHLVDLFMAWLTEKHPQDFR